MKNPLLPRAGLICILFSISVAAQVVPEQARNFQINETHTGSSSTPGLVPPLKQKWSVNFGQDMSYPLIVDGKVFVTVRHASSYGTTLYALNAADGATVWSYELGGFTYWSALCYESGRVFALNGDGLLRAFDGASGAVIWSRQLGGLSYTSAPVVFQGVVYLDGWGSSGSIVYAVSADSGNLLWTTTVSPGSNSSPAVTTDGVYLSYACENVNKLNPANGALVWRKYIAGNTGNGRAPVLYNGRLYGRSPGCNSDWIYDSQTGGLLDSFKSKTAPAFSGNMGFFLNGNPFAGTYGTLEGRTVDSNLVRWTFAGDGQLQSSMLVVNDYVYVGSESGKLYAVDASNGQLVWSTTAGTSIPPVIEWNNSQPLTGFAAGEGILVVPTKTTLVAYEPDNSPTITWGTPFPAPNSFGWNNTGVMLPFTPVAHPSGTAFADPPSPLWFTSEGANLTQQVFVTDQLGATATLTSPVVKIDINPPVTTSTFVSTFVPWITAWYKDSFQVTLTKTDSLSGVRSTSYTIDGGTTQNYVSPVTIQTDGAHTFVYWSSDTAGNNESPQGLTFNLDVNAPTTQISAGNGFYASPAQVALTATDGAGIGVANTFYRIDSGNVQTYSGPFMVSGDSNRQIVYWSTDYAGHTESQHFFTLKLDGSAPTTSISTSGTNGWNGWRTSAVQVTLSPSDTRSGVANTFYTVDGGPTQTYSGPFMINESAIHQLNYWSVDNVGNTEVQKSQTIKIDKEAPATESSLSGPAGNNGYFKGSVQVALSATDNVSGLATNGTSYKIDNGPQMAYMSSPFTVSGDGTHTVSYWSTDLAGNQASPNTITIKIDATAPATQAAPAGTSGGDGWYTSQAQVTLSATDAQSGVDSTYYAIDGGLSQPYTAPFNISNSGTHTILYWSVDRAGNAESQKSMIIKVDATAPATQVMLAGTQGLNGWYTSDTQVTLSVTEEQSGVENTFYKIDEGPQQTYSAPFNISNNNYHIIFYWSVDRAGNIESQRSMPIKVDSQAPTTAAQVSSNWWWDVWYLSPAQVYLNGLDNASGVANIYYTIDGGATQNYTATINISTGGVHVVNYWTVDVAGNTEAQKSVTVRVDSAAPTTQISTSGAGANGWYRGPVQVALTPTDPESGVNVTLYRVDGGVTQTYGGPFGLSGEGQHGVIYYSVDKLSHYEAQQNATVRIDSTLPVAQSSVSGTVGGNGYYKGPVQFSVTGSDNLSGVASIYYRINGGATQGYAAPLTISVDGNYSIDYWCVDVAGNASVVGTSIFKIDLSAPLTQATGSGTAGTNGWYRSSVQVSLSASDNLSGVQTTFYKLDGGTTKTYTAPFSVSGNGSHTVNFWSVDKATNTEAMGALAVNIDTGQPGVTCNVTPSTAAPSANPVTITVTGHATDTVSGVPTSGAATFSVVDEYGVTQPSGPITLQSNGNYSFTLALPATKNAGDNTHVYTITVRGTDRAGNTNTASDTLKIN